MFRNAFLFSNGMTGMAICIFNNQLVFHRIDYLVSLAVHAVPMLTMTRIRWYNIPREAELPLEQRTFATLEDTSKMTWFEFNRAMFALPILAYLVWATIWLLILQVAFAKQVKEKNWMSTPKWFGNQDSAV